MRTICERNLCRCELRMPHTRRHTHLYSQSITFDTNDNYWNHSNIFTNVTANDFWCKHIRWTWANDIECHQRERKKISFRFTKAEISVLNFCVEVILCRLKLTERMSETNACHMCKTFSPPTHSHVEWVELNPTVQFVLRICSKRNSNALLVPSGFSATAKNFSPPKHSTKRSGLRVLFYSIIKLLVPLCLSIHEMYLYIFQFSTPNDTNTI